MAWILLSSIVLCFMSLTVAWNSSDNSNIALRNNYENLLNFWKEHNGVLLSHGDYKEVVVVIGPTGAPKTALISALTKQILTRANPLLSTIIDEEEIVYDEITNVTYIDFPDFQQNENNIENEIAAIYFQNIILSQVEKIKLLLVINYGSLQNNDNNKDFNDLFEKIYTLIENINKFHDGIGLVVIKEDNTPDDSSVLTGIAQYLNDKKESYISENPGKSKILANLIDILLEKNDDIYARIAVFQKPPSQESSQDLTLMNSEIDNIIKMITENLEYVKKGSEDFGLILSESSKNTVDQIVQDTVQDIITNRLKKLGSEIIIHYSQMEKQYKDLELLRKTVSNGYEVISKIAKVETPLQLFKQLLNVTNTLNITVSLGNLNMISEDIETLHFFSSVAETDKNILMMFEKEAGNIIESVKHLKDIYEFLLNLQENLSVYKSQNLKNDTRIQEIIKACGSLKKNAVENIFKLKHIVSEVGSGEDYEKVKALSFNKFQKTHLKSIFRAFSTNFEEECTPTKYFTVKGYNVKLSDVIKSKCYGNAVNIRIFALNKVFIDASIHKVGAKGQIFIVAPTWEVIGKRKILLNGKAGGKHSSPFADSSSFTTENGANGLPGLPGGSAGHFFGIGKKFIGIQHLEIQANGGQGGPGQDGGNGSNGIKGEEVTNSFFELNQNPTELEEYFINHHFKYNLNLISERQEFNDMNVPQDLVYTADVHGKAATKPTKGGNGGIGGTGGNPGKILIVALGKSKKRISKPKTFNEPGSVGLNGQGGKGGNATSDGRSVKFHYSYGQRFPFYYAATLKNIEWRDGIPVPAGNDGKPGKNEVGRELPSKTPMLNLCNIFNAFKEFLRMNLFNNVLESELRSFVHEAENDNKILGACDTLDYVRELKGLENQCIKLKNKIEFLSFYNSFLNRVENYALTVKNLEKKKIISYVYTVALTKMLTLKDKRKGKTVVNLYKYLNIIESSVKELQENQQLQTVRSYRQEYKKTLENKIQEANDFIENKIEPEIKKLWKESDKQIRTIIDEIKQNKQSTEDAMASLEMNRSDLRNMMQMKALLFPVKLIVLGLSVMGPVGTGVGIAISSAAEVAEGMLINPAGGGGTNIPSISPILSTISRVTEALDEKPTSFADKLAEAVQQLEEYKEEFSNSHKENIEISQKIDNLKSKIEKVKNKKANSLSDIERKEQDTKIIEQELNELLNSQKVILENTKTKFDAINPAELNIEEIKAEKKAAKGLQIVKTIETSLNAIEMTIALDKELDGDEESIAAINSEISGYVNQINNLKDFEQKVLDTMMPDLRNIEKSVENIMKTMNGSSHAKTDVTKWTVRQTLKDVKLMLQKFTHEMTFEIQSDLARFIEKLDEGFSILMDIYDRIDSYSDSVKQAEYIEHITSAPMTNIPLTNSKLSDAVIDLKLAIQSNILFEKFETALHAFKQHYFPFAANVLQKFQLPTTMQLNNTETIRSTIITKIMDMKHHIDENEATIGEYSQLTHDNSIFNSNITGSSPFYVWKYDTIEDLIPKLLNGSEILIKADISKGVSHNSVKFNDIGINFKLQDKSLQRTFNSVLKNFELTLNMIGNNYYRCAERYYYLSFDDDIIISYTLNQDEAKNWINPNRVYSQIRNSHSFLGPYGLWSIKLKMVDPSVRFDEFKVYAKQPMDLELIGRGFYIEQDPDFNFDVCNDYLKNIYSVENIVKG